MRGRCASEAGQKPKQRLAKDRESRATCGIGESCYQRSRQSANALPEAGETFHLQRQPIAGFNGSPTTIRSDQRASLYALHTEQHTFAERSQKVLLYAPTAY